MEAAKLYAAPAMTVQECIDAFPEEWVLMRLEPEHSSGIITEWRGEVLIHSRSHKSVDREFMKLLRAGETGRSKLFRFEAVQYLTTGADVRAALEEMKVKGLPRDARQ